MKKELKSYLLQLIAQGYKFVGGRISEGHRQWIVFKDDGFSEVTECNGKISHQVIIYK